MYVFGIDGGGTKTIGVLCDSKGRIQWQGIAGPTNPNSLGYETVEEEMKRLIETLQAEAPEKFINISSFFAGMSGVDRDDDKLKMTQLFQKYLPLGCRIQVDNDAVNALYSGTLGKPGVVNISGTGSITFGINDNHERARVGGWGFILDDPGSGFSIGKRAVKAAFDEYDGYGEKTVLTSAILSTLGVEKVPELIPIIYNFKKSRETIASLSSLVVQAADAEDEIAKGILQQAGTEMGLNIRRLILKLFKDEQAEKKIPVVLTGGIYHHVSRFLPMIEENLKFLYIKPTIIIPKLPPVAGSVIAAIQNSGEGVNESFISHFN